jgi:hypothetical protein
VTSIEDPPPSLWPARNDVFVVHGVDNMIETHRRVHVLAWAGRKGT